MGNNRTRHSTEREESYAPLRTDHDHDHDHDHDEGQDVDEDEGEEYEMIKRKSSHDSESWWQQVVALGGASERIFVEV